MRHPRNALDVDTSVRASRGPYADAWLCGVARSGNGGVREIMATGLKRVTVGAGRAIHVDHRACLPDPVHGFHNVPRRCIWPFGAAVRRGGQNGARPVQILRDDSRADIGRPWHDRHWPGPAAAAVDPWQAVTVTRALSILVNTKTARQRTAIPRRASPQWQPSPRAGGENDEKAPRLPAPHSRQSGDETNRLGSNFRLRMAGCFAQCLNLEHEIHQTASKLCILGFEPLK